MDDMVTLVATNGMTIDSGKTRTRVSVDSKES